MADNFVRLVRAPFDQHIRSQRPQQIVRRVFVENEDVVHRRHRREHGGAIAFGDDRSRRSFQTLHASIAVHRDDQDISHRFGLFQVRHVTDVQQVEATVGQHNPLAAPSVFRQRSFRGRQVNELAIPGRVERLQRGFNFGLGNGGHADPLHFQTGRDVGQTHSLGGADVRADGRRQHRDDHVAGTGDVVNRASVNRKDIPFAPAIYERHAFTIEGNHRQFGVELPAETGAGTQGVAAGIDLPTGGNFRLNPVRFGTSTNPHRALGQPGSARSFPAPHE